MQLQKFKSCTTVPSEMQCAFPTVASHDVYSIG